MKRLAFVLVLFPLICSAQVIDFVGRPISGGGGGEVPTLDFVAASPESTGTYATTFTNTWTIPSSNTYRRMYIGVGAANYLDDFLVDSVKCLTNGAKATKVIEYRIFASQYGSFWTLKDSDIPTATTSAQFKAYFNQEARDCAMFMALTEGAHQTDIAADSAYGHTCGGNAYELTIGSGTMRWDWSGTGDCSNQVGVCVKAASGGATLYLDMISHGTNGYDGAPFTGQTQLFLTDAISSWWFGASYK